MKDGRDQRDRERVMREGGKDVEDKLKEEKQRGRE